MASPPYEIDENTYERFDQRRTVFARKDLDSGASYYGKGMYDKIEEVIGGKRRGYSKTDFARALAGWTVYDYFHGAFSWEKLDEANNVMEKPAFEDVEALKDKRRATREVKRTARLYGASLVGITGVDSKWVYSRGREGEEIELPDGYDYCIVMALKMDYEAIQESPNFLAAAASSTGYSSMAYTVSCTAEFLRTLGYGAIPMGNDTALSIPLAIDAGLGELGRSGLLITREYGSCVRLCKIFTDLPLLEDEPADLGIDDFCRGCRKCVEACEAGAIDETREPSYSRASPSNNKGILRWPVNHDLCYSFWIENGGDCSNCIAACPFTKGVVFD